MNAETPPPLPNQTRVLNEPAWRAYVRALIILFPAVLSWIFASLVLQPKVEMLWREAGLVGSRAQWLMSISHAFFDYYWFIFYGVVFLLMFLEMRVQAWRRFRRPVIFSASVLLNAAVMFWILTLALSATLAAPLVATRQMKAPPAGLEQGAEK